MLVPVGLLLRAVSQPLGGVDRRLVLDAVASRTASLTALAHAASMLGRTWVLILLTLVVGLGCGLMARAGRRAAGPLLALLGADLLQHVVKDLVARPRPLVQHLESVTGSSFPSGHASESSAVGVALILLAWRRPGRSRVGFALSVTLLVAAIGASRVYLGVHYPTDVVAGLLLGSGWGAVATWLVGREAQASKSFAASAPPAADEPPAAGRNTTKHPPGPSPS